MNQQERGPGSALDEMDPLAPDLQEAAARPCHKPGYSQPRLRK